MTGVLLTKNPHQPLSLRPVGVFRCRRMIVPIRAGTPWLIPPGGTAMLWHNPAVLISAGSADPAPVLLQYGALGVLALLALLAVRVLFNKVSTTADRERERADRLEDELRRLNETVRTEYLGTLAKATEAIADALAARRRG